MKLIPIFAGVACALFTAALILMLRKKGRS